MQQLGKILLLPAMLVAFDGMALDGDDVVIREEGGVYHIRMAFAVPASADQIKSVLTDFAHPSRLSSAVTAREVVSRQDGAVRVRTEFRDCVVFFCGFKLFKFLSVCKSLCKLLTKCFNFVFFQLYSCQFCQPEQFFFG